MPFNEDVELTEAQVANCRMALIGGTGLGFGMGYRIWLMSTSPSDPLRASVAAQAAVCEKVYDGATTLTSADAAIVADLIATPAPVEP